jgi:DNA polymerase-1
MERLYVVDGHGYIFRAHFGLMNVSRGERREVRLSTAEGFPTGAIYVFTRMLVRLHDDVRPEHIVVVFDAGRRGNFRNQLYTEYKANRPDPPEELGLQMPYFEKIVRAMNWPVLCVPGVEADDVIATLVERCRERSWETVIYSADKDMMQLIGPGVTMIDALHQRLFSREEVEKKFGVGPELVADWLALVGDTTDNIPGIPGVGGKTAATLLQQYGGLEQLIAANPVVPRIKVKQPFGDPEMLERIRVSRKLVELKRDVELPPIDELVAQPWNREELLALFTELEFSVLVDKLQSGAQLSGVQKSKVPAPPSAATPDTVGGPAVEGSPWTAVEIVVRPDALADLAAAARAAGSIGVWVEGSGERAERAHVVALAIAVAGRPTAYIPLGHRYIGAPAPPAPGDLAPIAAVLTDPAIAKRTHDGKLATRLLARIGIILAGVADDVALAAFLLDPTAENAAIDKVAGRLGAPPLAARSEALGRAHSLEGAPVEIAAPWVGQAAEAALRLAPALAARLEGGGLDTLYRTIELPVARILVELEELGIMVDLDHFRALGVEIGGHIAALERQVFELAGEELNLGSPKQLGHVLFEKLGLTSDRMKRTKTGFSTEAEVLEAMIDAHPVIKPILEHRELVKLKGTYLDALPPLIDPRTGRLHTTFNQIVAATGRISSQDPNLQNIPIRSEVGQRIRRGFVAAPGKVLLAADYSQIELRLLAHLSGDPVLTRAFKSRVDIHTETAAEVFGVPRDQVTAEHRRVAKAVNYGLAYGQSDFGLARTLDISRTQAHDYSQRYFERFPTIRRYMEDSVGEARARGGARTLLGRWRPIPDLRSKSPAARRAAERIAQNTPLQGAGADLIKLAMIKTRERLRAERLDVQMLLTVHDELVFEASPDHAERAAAAIKEEMERVYELAVPLDVDIGIATNWADA